MVTSSTLIGGKAHGLQALQTVADIRVPRFVALPVSSSPEEDAHTVEQFLQESNSDFVAVRSSAIAEDSETASFAGMYLTKLNVPSTAPAILQAISEVRESGLAKAHAARQYMKSLTDDSLETGMGVIVQDMVDPERSGVIFSHALERRDGYYVVSVAAGLGEKVVSGATNARLIRVARGVDVALIGEAWLGQLIEAMRRIELSKENFDLDVEFALQGEQLYILQCRPITTTSRHDATELEVLSNYIKSTEQEVQLAYMDDLLGDMIDINPAELLGSSPTALDISLFRYLFADTVVERVRRDMGYDPLNRGLLAVIAGKPYVSLRASAYSFRPLGIPDEDYEQLFRLYRAEIASNPALQTSVEFDLFAMKAGSKLESLLARADLSPLACQRIRASFGQLESNIVRASRQLDATLDNDISAYRNATRALQKASPREILQHVAVGTELFVKAARLAFFWKNLFEETRPDADLNKLATGYIHSPASRLAEDLWLWSQGELNRWEVIERYGHLRPGQFCLFGESYRDDPDHYLFGQMPANQPVSPEPFQHEYATTRDFVLAIRFLQAREEVKFLFSESLDLLACRIKEILASLKVKAHEVAGWTYDQLLVFFETGTSPEEAHQEHVRLVMPNVILPADINLSVVSFDEAAPTYIGSVSVKAAVCMMEQPDPTAALKGAIVVIPSADPGYDFLFHAGVAGIITKTGGPASHMCIRAIELQVPACIGCGEGLFARLREVETITLDCLQKQIVLP